MCLFVRALDPMRYEELEPVERVMFNRKWVVMIMSMATYLVSFIYFFLFHIVLSLFFMNFKNELLICRVCL
jgi:hypothetical protein